MRSDDSEFLENLFGKRAEILQKIKVSNKLSLDFVRTAKSLGFFRRASENLYEDVATKHFWKVNAENGVIERLVDVDQNGIIKE